MANRTRKVVKLIAFSDEEWELVKAKMALIGTENFSAYARKMLIDGYVIKHDFQDIKALVTELGAIGRNINQIAKRANESHSVHADDLKDLQRNYATMQGHINERLVKIIRKESR